MLVFDAKERNCAFVGTVKICKTCTMHGMNSMKVHAACVNFLTSDVLATFTCSINFSVSPVKTFMRFRQLDFLYHKTISVSKLVGIREMR